MKVTTANHRGNFFSVAKSKKDRAGFNKDVKFSKSLTKEAMTISTAEAVRITGRPNSEEKRSTPFKDTRRRRLILEELQEKKYLFLDSDLPRMLDDLLQRGHSSSRGEEVGRTTNPKYCSYHRMVCHPLEKWVMIKERIL